MGPLRCKLRTRLAGGRGRERKSRRGRFGLAQVSYKLWALAGYSFRGGSPRRIFFNDKRTWSHIKATRTRLGEVFLPLCPPPGRVAQAGPGSHVVVRAILSTSKLPGRCCRSRRLSTASALACRRPRRPPAGASARLLCLASGPAKPASLVVLLGQN